MPDSTAVIHPKFHHFNLKTTRLQEMIDFYAVLVGAEVNFQDARRRLAQQRRRPTTGSPCSRSPASRTTPRRRPAPACITAPSSTRASTSSTRAICV